MLERVLEGKSMVVNKHYTSILCGVLCFLFSPFCIVAESDANTDVLIYGATPAGITAALAVKREGKRPLLVVGESPVGGMMVSGLSGSDVCNTKSIGGLARLFFKKVGAHYKRRIAWRFEPHVAEDLFQAWLQEEEIAVRRVSTLQQVKEHNGVVKSLVFADGTELSAKVFIDSSYEGDLLALAGVPYTIGREARAEYKESEAGVHRIIAKHQFPSAISAFREDGTLLPDIRATMPIEGSADSKTMAYNFRLCVTTRRDNWAPIPAPQQYRESDYELLARIVAAKPHTRIKDLFEFLAVPNGKFDLNSKGGFSTDYIGANWDYPEASAKKRSEIVAKHKEYTLGLFHFLKTSEKVPQNLQATVKKLGLCKDEFITQQNWPYQLYIRVARRMQSDFVLTQNHLERDVPIADPVAVASCPIESHSVQRVHVDGYVQNEGWASKRVPMYQVPYRSMLPRRAVQKARNVLVPVALSASHIAYSSVRMEPVFMMLGESAGVAAAMAVTHGGDVHEIDRGNLIKKLRKYKQRLELRN